MTMRTGFFAVASCVAVAQAPMGDMCARAATSSGERIEQRNVLKTGEWGGSHLALTVRDDGASAEFDCGTATIDKAIVLNDKGAFDVQGKYIAEGHGPTRKGEVVPARPVRFTGVVKSDDLTLRVVLTDDDTALGPFAVSFKKTARLIKCR